MRSSLLFIFITITQCFLFGSCYKQQESVKSAKVIKKTVVEVKTSYRFAYHLSDSLTIKLLQDTSATETNVIGLNLSNGQQFTLSPRILRDFTLEMVDLNFDGYGDIKAYREGGATGNEWYDCWLYNPQQKQWMKNGFLSNACSPELDTLNRKLIAYYSGGWADQLLSVYTVSDTSFKLIEDWYVEPRSDTSMIYINHIKGRRLIKRDSIQSNWGLRTMYNKRNGLNTKGE